METILNICWSISSGLLILLVMLHSPKGEGLGAIGGQGQMFSSTRSAEANLNRITWVMAIIFLLLTLVLSAGWVNS
ncbi:MAG: preprotein translocase subunit SecG [Synechococcales cyanobacterium]